MPGEYPASWEADVVLRDGRTCHIRPITPQDSGRLVDFHARLSPETIYFRFFAPYPRLTERDVERFTNVDHDRRVALVATVAGELIAVARFDAIDARSAEVAFVVRDDHQGRGVGALLLEHLAAAAWERGVRRFVAEVLPENRRMLSTFRDAGYAVRQRVDDGVYHLTLEIEPTDKVESIRSAREHRNEARSVERLLNPHGVAVIGASRVPGRVGHKLLRHLRDYGHPGPLYAINPEVGSILDVPAYPRISELPERVDLAVVAVPAESVQGVVAECAAAGVSGLVVVSAGFADTDSELGRTRQQKLVSTAREAGMRVVGPNCLGIINTDPRSLLNASLAPLVPRRGRVGLFCQSGALGVPVLETVARRGLGLSSFVSAGNRADVSANDLLQYWESDPSTDLVLLYLESIGNPRKFTRITRRLSRSKPVVAVRSGRFTQTLPLGGVGRTTLPSAAVDAIFEQSGVVATSSLAELFDVAAVLAYQPLPQGDRVAVVGTSVALEILAADAIEAARLTVAYGHPSLPQSASAEQIRAALRSTAGHPSCDAVVFVHIPSVGADQAAVHDAITAVAVDSTKPILAVMPAADGTGLIPAGLGLLAVPGADGHPERGSVPTFSGVEDAVAALALVRGYARWRESEGAEAPSISRIDTERALELVDRWVGEVGTGAVGTRGGAAGERPEGARGGAAQGGSEGARGGAAQDRPGSASLPAEIELDADRVAALLGCYGIRVWRAVPVASADDAVAAAAAIGYPVVLKTTAPWLAHRADLGGVRLNIESEEELRRDFSSMAASLDDLAARRLVVQRMAPPGVACVAGAVDDLLFGPVVRFGLGGVASELLGDLAYRVPPITVAEARRMVDAPKAAPLLRGYRGTEPVDTEALCDLVMRLGRLVDEVGAVASVDLNPIIVAAEGAAVVGASVRLRSHPELAETRRLLDG